jgi:GH25 family lysozyme M1 (1,4-beta-N-acetylmuramidase)
MSDKYVLNEKEYDALEKVLSGSHLDEYLELRQKGSKLPTFPVGAYDYFRDHEENKDMSLKEGLEIVYDAAIDYKVCYHMSDEDIEDFRQLLIKMNIIDNTIELE